MSKPQACRPHLVAPDGPGIDPRWTSSAKSGVGTSIAGERNLWFTISHGIVNEVYYPRVDRACMRDMGLIVTGPEGFFSEEKRDTVHQFSWMAPGVPAFRLTNTCVQGRYRIEKEVLPAPDRDALVQRIRFTALEGKAADYRLYVLLSPHLENGGKHNTGWVGEYKGDPMLFASRHETALALASSVPLGDVCVGFVGQNDGWTQLQQAGHLAQQYTRADNGNVALCGELPVGQEIILALAFNREPDSAGNRARSVLWSDFDAMIETYTRMWQDWLHKLLPLDKFSPHDMYRGSACVLRTHEATDFPGGFIASLSIPWGDEHGDDDLGGYHLVWPRDMVETVGALMAAGSRLSARRALHYLRVVQEPNGSWPQNMWINGIRYWKGSQLDETAFPVLLVDLALREGILTREESQEFWPMVRSAASFLVTHGPCTDEDRWEEASGYTAYTLGAVIAALLATADLADAAGEKPVGIYLRELADAWNSKIEQWTYARNTPLARKHGVDGYYIRIAPPAKAHAASPLDGSLPLANQPEGEPDSYPAIDVVSPDALDLVRFGLRRADDPRILNTIKVVDGELKVDTPTGPCWHRYNHDGYGEHADGSGYNGSGLGRLWPLLTGERAHYELAAGNLDRCRALLAAMESFAGEGGLLPEQIWDTADIPQRELFFGRPSGSAMPLVWAHAEHVKLLRSLRDGKVFDMPSQTVARYLPEAKPPVLSTWRFSQQIQQLSATEGLRIELFSAARVLWSADGWKASQTTDTTNSTLGTWYVDVVPPPGCKTLEFTFQWPDHWEGRNYQVQVVQVS